MQSTQHTSMHIFGTMDLAFSSPHEFGLPPQLFTKDPSTTSNDAEGREVNDWLSNLPINALMTPASSSASSGNVPSNTIPSGPLSVLAPKSQWPVINLPLSSKKAIRLDIDCATTTSGQSLNKTNDNSASLLFQQLVVDENRRPYTTGNQNGTATDADSQQKDASFFSFLRSGMDPHEVLPANITPTQLLFALGELQRRFTDEAANIDAGLPSSQLSERMRVATMSEAFVRFLAWQRLGQVISEVDAVRSVRRSVKDNNMLRSREEDDRMIPLRPAKKTRREGTRPASDDAPSSELYTDGATLDAGIASPATNVENRIQLFTTLANILSQGSMATSVGTSAGSDGSAVCSLVSKATQCRMTYPGLNTTLPYADATKVQHTDLSKAIGLTASAATASGPDERSPFGERIVDLRHCLLSHGKKLSLVIVQIWNVRSGLIGATIVGEGGGNINDEVSMAASTPRPKALRVRLPYGVTTVGKEVSDEVSIGVGSLEGAGFAATISPQHLRISVAAAERKDNQQSAPEDNPAMPSIKVLSCGGGLGLRVQGARWSYGDVLPVRVGQIVRFGANLALGFMLLKE